MKKFLSALAAALLLVSVSCSALADSVTMNGTVVNIAPQTISASLGGTVREIFFSAGDQVKAGDVLVTLEGEKVYALQDGTVHFFGEVGDSAEMVAKWATALKWWPTATARWRTSSILLLFLLQTKKRLNIILLK